MMADKKVDRYRPERALDATQQTKTALSTPDKADLAEWKRFKGRSSLLDKFRSREERWRREQSLRDREAAGSAGIASQFSTSQAAEPPTNDPGQGGAK